MKIGFFVMCRIKLLDAFNHQSQIRFAFGELGWVMHLVLHSREGWLVFHEW